MDSPDPHVEIAQSRKMHARQGPHLRQVMARWQQYRTEFQLTGQEADEAMRRRINADTHKMSPQEVKKLGLFRRPPGYNAGTTLHASKSLFSQSEILVLLPLGVMVVLAGGLGLMTAYRELWIDPTVEMDKRRRKNSVAEIEHHEEVLARAERKADSPFRRISRPSVMAHVQHEPPVLPGDDTAELGQPGSRHKYGKPLGGGY